MAALEKCSYCQRDMSSDFSICPHCKKIVPMLVFCRICEREMNSKEAIVHGNYRRSAKFFHSQCYKAVLNEQKCPTCKHTFSENEQKELTITANYENYPKASCSNCGQTYIDCGACDCCQMVLFNNAIHKACLEGRQVLKKREKEAEKKQQDEREKAGLCIHCGGKLTFWERLWSKKHSPDNHQQPKSNY